MNIATDAPLRVAVVFEPGKRPRPVWFVINNRKCVVKEITYAWVEDVGSKALQHFTVTDGDAALYHLVYSPSEGKWVMADQVAMA